MTTDNKGYSLTVSNRRNKEVHEKVYLKPMSLYIPALAAQAVTELVNTLSGTQSSDNRFVLAVTNNNNGVSAEKDFADIQEMKEPTTAANTVKDLINIIRGYDTDEEINVCGW